MTAALVADEQLHATAVLTVLNAALPTQTRAYDVSEVPDTKPPHYVEVMLSRRFGGARRASADTGTGGWRIATRVVDKESVTDARNTASKVRDALEFARLAVAGKQSTPVQFEGAEPIGPDDGWWSGLTTWTYVL